MSNVVSALVQKRKVGSPTRNAILMFTASCAGDDGTGVWSSKATMARDLEMGKRTVQFGVDDLMTQGLISEVGKRACAHGYTAEYRLNLAVIQNLEPTKSKSFEKPRSEARFVAKWLPNRKGAGDTPVQEVHPTGAGDAPQDVQEMHPNPPLIVQEPVCSADAAQHTDTAFNEFWGAYPRPRDRAKTLQEFEDARAAGVDVHVIIAGAKAYAEEQVGNGRAFMAYSDTWLAKHRWEDHNLTERVQDGISVDAVKQGFIRAIQQGHGAVARHCPVPTALELVASNAVTKDQCRAVGLSL